MLRDGGEAVAPPGVPLTEGLLLDELAVVRTSTRRTLGAAVEVLRSGGLGGVLVAVLGALDVDEAERLARLRTGSAVCVAVVLDTDSWAPLSPGPARPPPPPTTTSATCSPPPAGASCRSPTARRSRRCGRSPAARRRPPAGASPTSSPAPLTGAAT